MASPTTTYERECASKGMSDSFTPWKEQQMLFINETILVFPCARQFKPYRRNP